MNSHSDHIRWLLWSLADEYRPDLCSAYRRMTGTQTSIFLDKPLRIKELALATPWRSEQSLYLPNVLWHSVFVAIALTGLDRVGMAQTIVRPEDPGHLLVEIGPSGADGQARVAVIGLTSWRSLTEIGFSIVRECYW